MIRPFSKNDPTIFFQVFFLLQISVVFVRGVMEGSHRAGFLVNFFNVFY